ncbi:hypothetical protein BDP27DRAFT_1320294 [Rhodocollybia butyracea]|uniref:Ricin B lectin domain-containing protein n=1 Tax=Rhodocollybia butyracea TaxID=206335 RepID=A0A9P5Q0V6_9AGAR|nr:hypothetical protein BDP27DRAFT_1320294 [Rhodocollybia butyracea]
MKHAIYHIKSAANPSQVLDVSGQNRRSVLAYSFHGGQNQQWEVMPNGAGFAIRSVLNGAFISLDIDNDKKIREVVVTAFPIIWNISSAEGTSQHRIYWADSSLAFTFKNPNSALELSMYRSNSQDILWQFSECSPAPSEVPPAIVPLKPNVKPVAPSVGRDYIEDSTASSANYVVAGILLPDIPGAPDIYSKYIIKARYRPDDEQPSTIMALSVNSDIAVPRFRSKGVTESPSQSLLKLTFKEWRDVSGFAEFSGMIGAGQFFIITDQEVVISGPIEGGPAISQRFVGTGTWTMS